MYRQVEGPPSEAANSATKSAFNAYIGTESTEVWPGAMQILFTMFAASVGLVHIPKDKTVARPRLDTFMDGAFAMLRAKQIFSALLKPVHVNISRVTFLMTLISLGRGALGHTMNFASLLLANLASWEREVHNEMEFFYERAAPFAKDDPALADMLVPVHDHFHEAAERGAERAAENRELRKEARQAGLKEGEDRARGQARKDANAELLDMMDIIRRTTGKALPEGNDR